MREWQATQEKLKGELNAKIARQEELKTALKVAKSEASCYKDIAKGL